MTADLGTATRREVAFAATAPARAHRLTWAQQHLLLLIDELAPMTETLNVRFRVDLRPGLSTDQVLTALRRLVETFEALRSVVVRPPGGDARLEVAACGNLPVDVVDASQDGEAPALADRAVHALGSRPFDLTGELPVRAVLVTAGGAPRHLAMALSHLAVDHTGATWALGYLRAALARPGAVAREPDSSFQPADEVAWEDAPEGHRHGERALAQQEATFRAMPQTMLPRALDHAEAEGAEAEGAAEGPAAGRYRYLQLDSVALALASQVLAVRHAVSPTAVLHAGLCAVVGSVSRLDRACLQLTVGNRVARNRLAVGMHTLDVPAAVDLADADVAELVARSGRAVPQAVRFGQYPPLERLALRRAVERERGVHLDLTCWLNDRRVRGRTPPAAAQPDAATLAAAARDTAWRWVEGSPNSTSSFFVFADDAGRALRLTMIVDSWLVPPDEAVAWLRGLERLLVAATAREVALPDVPEVAGIVPRDPGPGWVLTDHSWAHLPTTAELVRAVAGVPRVDVAVEPTPDGDRLVARVDPGDRPPPDPARLAAAVVAALPGVRTAVAPHRYVVRRGPAVGEAQSP